MRHRGQAPNQAALQAAAEASRAKAKKPSKGRGGVRGISDEAFLAMLDEVNVMLKEGKWQEAEPKHFVALYADLHFRVYGVEACELGPKERVFAAKLAGDMLRDDFAGDRSEFAKFVSWAWTREKSREEWRRTNHKEGGRVSWRLQFSRSLLTDFRIDEARKKAAR